MLVPNCSQLHDESVGKMSAGAGLLDLVARGKKDTFFTGSPQVSFFHSVYVRHSAYTREKREIMGRNAVEWGRFIDFEITAIGEILQDLHLQIQLPSWLMDTHADLNATSLIRTSDGTAIGYVNGVAYHLVEKVQLFLDQYTLQEIWGEYLYFTDFSRQPEKAVRHLMRKTGTHAGSQLEVQRNATPGMLRLKIPLPGLQKGDLGLPLAGLQQNLRLRVHLRRLEQIVESIPNTATKPAPWSKQFTIQKTENTNPESIPVKRLIDIDPPTICLEAIYLYLPPDLNAAIRSNGFNIVYQQYQRNEFTLDSSKYPYTGQSYVISKDLDFKGSTQRLLVAFQSDAARQQNRLYNYRHPNETIWYDDLRVVLFSRDRIESASTFQHTRFASYNYASRESWPDVSTISFVLEDSIEPKGTLNLSKLEGASMSLSLTLSPIQYSADDKLKKSYIVVYAENWNVLEYKNGYFRLLFAD